MKKTKLLISLIAIVILLSINFCTIVRAVDDTQTPTVDAQPSTDATQPSTNTVTKRIYAIFSDSYYGSEPVTNQSIELAVGYSAHFIQVESNKPSTDLTGYTLESSDPSVLAVDGVKITAKKRNVDGVKLTLTPESESDRTIEYTVKVYEPDEYRTKRENEEIKSELSMMEELLVMDSSTIDYDKFNFAIDAAKELGLNTLKINVNNKVIWEFPVEGTEATKNFVPSVNVATEKMPTIESDTITDALFVDFAYSGNLPGKANVTLNVGTDKFGTGEKTLYLYYYNPTTKSYEFVEDAKYSNGQVKLSLTHCSTYALVENKIDETQSSESNNKLNNELDDEPKTGETSVLGISLLAIVSLAMAVIIRKK